jgi:cellulose synthase (UDP-forming)
MNVMNQKNSFLPQHTLIIALYLISGITYLSWRFSTFNQAAPTFSYLFYLADCYSFISSLLIIFLSFQKKETALNTPPAPQGLSVDVFITTYNESVTLVRRTVVAATRIAYPHQTVILDDGNRPEMRQMAEDLGCLYYPRTNNIGAKAGNLNNGLQYSKAEFIAIFDADHIPQINFLDRLLSYFDNPKISFVQTPQDFFNLDSYQHGREKDAALIWHEQSFFHYVTQVGRDFWNSATLCGSSVVMRRSALDAIGGFPTDTVTEDMHTSVKLQKLGYLTAYHAEPLAFGLAPHDFRGFARQRLRWGEGNLQVCREEGLPFFCKGLSLAQRVSYFSLVLTYLDGWMKLFYYLTPAFVLITQTPPLVADPLVFMALFTPYIIITFLFYDQLGRGYGRLFTSEKYVMARLGIALLATLGLFRKYIQFRVTSKSLIGEVPWLLLVPQLLVATASIGAIGFVASQYLSNGLNVMSLEITIFVGFWATISAFLAVLVIKDALRSGHLTENAEDYVFNIPLIIALAREQATPVSKPVEATIYAEIQTISLNECEFYTENSIDLFDNSQFSGSLYLPSQCFACTATVIQANKTGNGHRIKARIEWPSQLIQDDVEHLLYAGRWSRLLLNQQENTLTPLQHFQSLFEAESINAVNTPVLCRNASTTLPSFAILTTYSNNPTLKLTVFTALSLNVDDSITLQSHHQTFSCRILAINAPNIEAMGLSSIQSYMVSVPYA